MLSALRASGCGPSGLATPLPSYPPTLKYPPTPLVNRCAFVFWMQPCCSIVELQRQSSIWRAPRHWKDVEVEPGQCGSDGWPSERRMTVEAHTRWFQNGAIQSSATWWRAFPYKKSHIHQTSFLVLPPVSHFEVHTPYWSHPQSRKYIMYCTVVRGGPISHIINKLAATLRGSRLGVQSASPQTPKNTSF